MRGDYIDNIAGQIAKLKEWGYTFVDAQVPTEHLKSLGAIEVYRDFFLELLYKNRDLSVSDDAWKVYGGCSNCCAMIQV